MTQYYQVDKFVHLEAGGHLRYTMTTPSSLGSATPQR